MPYQELKTIDALIAELEAFRERLGGETQVIVRDPHGRWSTDVTYPKCMETRVAKRSMELVGSRRGRPCVYLYARLA